MSFEKVTLQITMAAPLAKAWAYWTQPEHIMQWNFADPSWHCPAATNDLRVGGSFNYRMAARDGSFAFDFEGIYDAVEPEALIAYHLADGRTVRITFDASMPSATGADEQVLVTQTFDAETENPIDMQRAGWQAIMDNYKRVVEENTGR
ncbi:MAG: SRPBCC family protein [Sphingobacteriaceae bacterium]|nr:SRPBCC family protein [Sphingobacteriaceae bacterium]